MKYGASNQTQRTETKTNNNKIIIGEQ